MFKCQFCNWAQLASNYKLTSLIRKLLSTESALLLFIYLTRPSEASPSIIYGLADKDMPYVGKIWCGKN